MNRPPPQGIAYRLGFEPTTPVRDWNKTKRLGFGNLLCITPDRFQTLFWANIVNRESDLLKEGITCVEFKVFMI